MKYNVFYLLCGLSLFAQSAMAQDTPSYSYLEYSALEYDLDVAGIDIEPDGYKLKLSAELGDSLFVMVDRIDTEGRFLGDDFDFNSEGYGFGLHGDLWYASYSYNTWELERDEFDVDTIRLGFRTYLIDDLLELNASYSWNDIEDADKDDGFQVGFVYELTEVLHITAEYETIGGNSDVDYLSLGIRLSF